MNNPASATKSSVLAKALGPLLSDPPWAAKSFLAAGATTVAGTGAWLSDMMSPTLARAGAGFLGGFLLGWAFRKTLKLALMVTISLVAVIAILKTTGWIHLEWTLIESDVNRTLDWARGQTQVLKDMMILYLPSAGAAGAGAFFGFRGK